MKKFLLPLLVFLLISNGCTSMSTSEKSQKRKELDTMTGSTILRLLKQYPDLLSEIEKAPAYMVTHIETAANGGEGVLIINNSEQRRYFTVEALEVGSNWGTRSFKILLVLKTQQMLDRFSNGMQKFAENAVSAKKTSPPENNEYMVYIMSDSGVAVTATVKMLDYRVNHALMNF